MSYRPLISKFVEAGKLRQLLSSENLMLIRTQLQHNSIKMRRPWNNPSILSPQMVKRYWETIPLVVLVLGGVTCAALWTLRLACTRDDVCYFEKAPFEDYTRIKKNQPPPIKKFRIYNQRYCWPPGLVAALKDGEF
ncbi:uncharacterized protein [Eurosta solidaginis]|uniref:uncharacterized protein isoform X2 n=1 Tax=Eurosta solidaginis TaxID=178769 RepID=UPI0035308AC7